MDNINEHDMTKHMLDKLRGGGNVAPLNENTQVEKSSNQPQQLDEHDMTKQMLNTIRKSEINENQQRLGQLLTEGDNDVIKVEDDDLKDEVSTITSQLGGIDLHQYDVFPKTKNVVMVGVLDNGIKITFDKGQRAPYINAQNLRLDVETLKIIEKIQGYYLNWVDSWATKIGEYTRSA